MTLSKTKKKGRENKESLVKSVRQCLEDYSTLYIFGFENMRNTKFKEFRDNLKDSSRFSLSMSMANFCFHKEIHLNISHYCMVSLSNRFFLGSNKVLQIALGRTEAEEVKDGLHKASEV